MQLGWCFLAGALFSSWHPILLLPLREPNKKREPTRAYPKGSTLLLKGTEPHPFFFLFFWGGILTHTQQDLPVVLSVLRVVLGTARNVRGDNDTMSRRPDHSLFSCCQHHFAKSSKFGVLFLPEKEGTRHLPGFLLGEMDGHPCTCRKKVCL